MEDHDVGDILQKIINASNSLNNLMINAYFNLLLSSYINDNSDDGENNEILLKSMEKEEKIKNYNKQLFVSEAEIDKPNEPIWSLIENNKDIAYEAFFSNQIEYLVISCLKKIMIVKHLNAIFFYLQKGLN